MNDIRITPKAIVIAAGAAIAIAALGPWLTGIGFSISGISGDMEGRYTGPLAIVAIITAFVAQRRIAGGVGIGIGALAAFLALSRLGQLNSWADANNGPLALSAGWGLWLTLVAALILIVGAALMLRPEPTRVQQSE